jgi:iron(III) transport system permease protein
VNRAQFGRALVVVAIIVALGVLIVLPLGSVLLDSIFVGDGNARHLSAQNFLTVAVQLRYWEALGNTVLIAAGATLIATATGVALAWVLVRTNAPFAGALESLAVLPIFIPPFVGAFAWLLLAAPRIGLANVALRNLGLPEPFDVYTRFGIVCVIGIYLAPYVLMIVASALRSMDPSLEEVGQVAGLNRWRVAATITLPVVAPSFLSVLAFVIAIGLFGTPVLLGWPNQILVLTSRIYLESQQVPPAYGVMAVLAIYLMVMSGAVVFLQQWAIRGRNFITVTGKGFRPRVVAFGGARIVLSGAVAAYVAMTVVVPVLVIVAAALSTYAWSGRLTWSNMTYLWTSDDVRETLRNSVVISVVSATAAAFLGLCVAWLVCRTRTKGRHLLEYLVLMPLSVPSIAFGLGVAALWLRLPWDLYDTIWIIVIVLRLRRPFDLRQPGAGSSRAGGVGARLRLRPDQGAVPDHPAARLAQHHRELDPAVQHLHDRTLDGADALQRRHPDLFDPDLRRLDGRLLHPGRFAVAASTRRRRGRHVVGKPHRPAQARGAPRRRVKRPGRPTASRRSQT